MMEVNALEFSSDPNYYKLKTCLQPDYPLPFISNKLMHFIVDRFFRKVIQRFINETVIV